MAYSSLLWPLSAGSITRPTALPQPTLLFRIHSLPRLPQPRRRTSSTLVAKLRWNGNPGPQPSKNPKESTQAAAAPARDEEEKVVEENLPWIQEKALDLVEFTGTVTQAIPGPRVAQSQLPWLLAVPLAWVGLSFVIGFVKAVRKFTSPRAQRKRLVNKNAFLLKSIDELFLRGKDEVNNSALKELMQKTGFSMEEILRKYIRYTLNEKPFNPDMVLDLIHLRNSSLLEDAQVAEILNEVSRRIVKEKGPVVMDLSGFTEKGFKRKLAVQALFGKILYLSELPEFCSRDSSLIVKEIFGVTDEDTDILRMHTLSETDDIESVKKMVDDSSLEEDKDGSSSMD
ncbi:hypothetical protein C4D60_Mb05t07020 [Musa balbisiana]|uniref:Armadillo-like repeats domain-containing protein n=1 Tax=Musa balbisiana TaxID=52838 RepID=A0A4S8JUB2_MUSBA|nr:hypothetical protein C4D60_Mb05t07020 [Musa balbisiana]